MVKSLLSVFRPGQTELDFSDFEQAQAYIDLFGGEEYVRSKYPLFYRAWQQTQKSASEQLNDTQSGIQTYGGSLDMIHTVTDQKTCSDNDSVSTRLVSDARFTGVPPVSVFMQGEMSDETEHTLIDAFSTLYTPEDFDGNDFLTKTFGDDLKNVYADKTKMIHAQTAFSYSDNNGMLRAERCEQKTTLLGGSEMIKEMAITDPKSSKNNRQINYVYGRPADANTDYSVTDEEAHVERNHDGTGKSTGIYMKINGEFTTIDTATPIKYAVDAQSYKTQLQFANEGVVYYDHDSSEIAKFFKVSGKKVEFSYAPFWGAGERIDCRKFGTNTTLYLHLQGYFKCDLGGKLGECNIPFSIKSVDSPSGSEFYYSKNSSEVYIPPLHILWGCFSKKCWVRMADGSKKVITELVSGETVKCEDGSSAEVISVSVGGHEDKMVHIQTVDGHLIEVSDYHPVKTKDGTVAALDLRPNDVVVLEDGESPILYIYLVDYDDEVCSVLLNGKFLIANGFVTGDAEVQKNVQHRAAETLGGEALALSKEMEDAFKELL